MRHASSTGVLESFKHCLTMSQHRLLAAATHIVNTDVAQDGLMLCCSEFKENKQEQMSDVSESEFLLSLKLFPASWGIPVQALGAIMSHCSPRMVCKVLQYLGERQVIHSNTLCPTSSCPHCGPPFKPPLFV